MGKVSLMANGDIQRLLAELVKRQAATGPLAGAAQNTAVAKALLSPATKPFSSDSTIYGDDPRGPSPVMRILDLLSRPLYGVANVAKARLTDLQNEGFSPESVVAASGRALSPITNIGDFWEGFSGREKTTGADLTSQLGMPEGFPKAALSFATDVTLDPLTYAGVGLAGNLGKGVTKSVTALRGVETTSGAASRSVADELSRLAAQQSRVTSEYVPTGRPPRPSIPALNQAQEAPRTFVSGPGETRLALPAGPNEPTRPLNLIDIAEIKNAVSRGLTLQQAAPRPLNSVEERILSAGVAQGKSAKRIRNELMEAGETTSPTAPVAIPGPYMPGVRPTEGPLGIVDIAQIKNAVVQGTPISQLIPEGLTARQTQILTQGIAQGKSAKVIRNELAAITEESVEGASELFPITPTRVQPPRVFPDRITDSSSGSTSVVSTGDSIATPIPKPQSAREILEETLQGTTQGPNWKRLVEEQVKHLGEGADRLTIIRALDQYMNVTKSPVTRNMIRKQLEKLREGVTPAQIIPATRAVKEVPEFPRVTLTAERRQVAENIASDFMRTHRFDNINHIGQTNLFNRIQTWTIRDAKLPKQAQAPVAFYMLRVAEDALLAAGKKLEDAEGLTSRLSDVINAAGGHRAMTSALIDSFRRGRPLQALEDVKAKNAPIVAQEIIDPILQIAKTAASNASQAGLSTSRTVALGSELSEELGKLAERAGAASKETQAAKDFIQDLFNTNRDALFTDLQREARELLRQTATGRIDSRLTHRVNKSVYDSLQGNPKILGRQIPQTKVVEAIMTRFATWWNAKDLRPFAREYIDTARNVAAAFGEALTPLVRSTKPSQRTSAWRVAQGKVSPGSAEELELANRFKYLIENLMGAHGVPAQATSQSVLARAGVTMKSLNKELPEQLRFVDVKGIDELGRPYDYSDGKWMHSWKEWKSKEPAEDLYQLTRALQLVTRKNAMLDDAAARWGMPIKGGEFQHTVDIERLNGFYFSKEIAEQLQTTWNKLEDDKFFFGGKWLQMFDQIQRMWKTGVTIYSPSHHIRNLNGDIFMSMLDGVVSPKPYRVAVKVLHAHRTRYRDSLEQTFGMMDSKLRDIALKARPGNVVVTTRAGHKLTAEQVYQAAESQGFLLRAAVLEDLVGASAVQGRFAPFGGRVHSVAAGTSELRDHYVRLAHFIDILHKSKEKNLRDAVEIAGRRVKKWHPDGSDLTGFEQSIMRRLIPFYSWLRKATPLVIEGVAMRPHITMLFPKAMLNMQEITGVESEGPGNPFPMDSMFPEWIKEKGVGPVLPPDSPLSEIGRQQTWRGDAPGYTIINPTNPFIDQVMELFNPRKAVMSGLTPGLRIPAEIITGHTSLGIPLQEVEGGTVGHLLQQVPPVGIGARITGLTRPDEPWHPEQLTNWLLTGGLVTGTGPYKSQAQFEIRELLTSLGKKERESRR